MLCFEKYPINKYRTWLVHVATTQSHQLTSFQVFVTENLLPNLQLKVKAGECSAYTLDNINVS